ncbi:MAG TPA: hypothetical protein VL122_11330 [Nitrospirota bacterium]|nr:hypothetical protein [Nitrospirota bacterium]
MDKEPAPELNECLDPRVIEASRHLYDAINRKLKAVESNVEEVELPHQ